jgi:alginate O-acetyltransferase complex protein AlgI
MLFNSLEFLIFFPTVTILFFLLPHKLRWALLLTASCIFYMFFKPEYILILGVTIAVDYFAGILIANEPDKKRKRLFLILAVVVNILVLAVFKYYNFLNDQVTGIASTFGYTNQIPYLQILLPLGLSFHTFQGLSYILEVYRENQKPEKHFGIFSLYVMFYPQLVAGPIERPQNMLHQYHQRQSFNYDNALLGLNLMIVGFFKKIVVADRLAVYVDLVFADISSASTISMTLAIVFFAFQIYADFGGYSDIARGTAKVMGYDLMINFDQPFKSKNITEFWRRWHISLSSWFNDYLFTPIVINKRHWGNAGVVFGLFVTFTLSGLWHGAGWTFIIFGMLHGFAIIWEFLTKKKRKRVAKKVPAFIYNNVSIFLTFSFACVTWIFFRSANMAQVKMVFLKLASLDFSLSLTQISANKGPLNLLLSFFAILLLLVSYKLPKDFVFVKRRYNLAYLTVFIFFIIVLGKDAGNEFIYFQF